MSSDFPTFAEQGEENIRERNERDMQRFLVMMRFAPKEDLDDAGRIYR